MLNCQRCSSLHGNFGGSWSSRSPGRGPGNGLIGQTFHANSDGKHLMRVICCLGYGRSCRKKASYHVHCAPETNELFFEARLTLFQKTPVVSLIKATALPPSLPPSISLIKGPQQMVWIVKHKCNHNTLCRTPTHKAPCWRGLGFTIPIKVLENTIEWELED